MSKNENKPRDFQETRSKKVERVLARLADVHGLGEGHIRWGYKGYDKPGVYGWRFVPKGQRRRDRYLGPNRTQARKGIGRVRREVNLGGTVVDYSFPLAEDKRTRGQQVPREGGEAMNHLGKEKLVIDTNQTPQKEVPNEKRA